MEEEEEERLGEESQHQDKEDISAERAAAALLLLSQPKKEIDSFSSSLWEGIIFTHYNSYPCVIRKFVSNIMWHVI